MNWGREDVIAVANNRYMRRAGNKILGLMVALLVVGFGGVYLSGDNNPLRWILLGVTVAAVLVAYFIMDKGQRKERDRLLAEWKKNKEE
jgi:uncharacterized protein YacL